MGKKFLLIMILSVTLLFTACSKNTDSNNEIKQNNEVKNEASMSIEEDKLSNSLKGNYIHVVTEYEPGQIIYFKDDKEIVSIFSYHADSFDIKEMTSDSTSATYRLETNEFGEPKNIINATLNITQEEDTVSMTWIYDDSSSSLSQLKILTAKECIEAIYKAYPNYEHDKDWNYLGLTDSMFSQIYSSKPQSNNTNKPSKKNTVDNKTVDNKKESDSNKEIKISDKQALEICKSKLKGVLSTQYLRLGDNKYGMVKTITYKDIMYYCIYWEDEEVAADYRFLVNSNTGEVFYEDVSAFGKLTPIKQYIESIKSEKEEPNDQSQNNTEENKMTQSEALSICTDKLKSINAYEDRYGEGIVSNESDGYYYITYDCGESYAVNIDTKEVYYVVPAGDGLNGPL